MKKLIAGRLFTVVMTVVFLTLSLNYVIEIIGTEKQMDEASSDLFWQIEQILAQNNEELLTIEADHRSQCMDNADAAAYILSHTPSIMDSIDELKKIADFLHVDEIHIFNENGEIVNGTEPKYYGLTVDSGEQIGFFKAMLNDKSLKLCQDITPNTAESKMMQYAAVWNDDQTMIVQIGMEPTRVLELTKKNELSYIFSLLTTDHGSELYAANIDTGIILGSTNTEDVDKTLEDLGIDLEYAQTHENGFHAMVNGVSSYCVFTQYGDILIGRVCSSNVLYGNIINNTLYIALYLIIISIFIFASITIYLNKNIVNGIADVNKGLKEITKGNFKTTVNVDNTPEFVQLSEQINTMVSSILDTTGKISYILEKAGIPIGVFEYSETMTRVRATHQVEQILNMSEDTAEAFFSHYTIFENYLHMLSQHTLESDPTIYKLPILEERYIRMESFEKNDGIIGYIMDVTDEVHKRQRIENERDLDMLTQLYNRRGLEYKLEKLFNNPEIIKHGAMIMLDSDGLKTINDRFGHKAGDKYLCATADLLKTISAPKHIIARQGGDEFVLFLYGCNTRDELLTHIQELDELRMESYFMADDNTPLPISYSYGYALYKSDGNDYVTLLREADMRMYTEKRQRKLLKHQPNT